MSSRIFLAPSRKKFRGPDSAVSSADETCLRLGHVSKNAAQAAFFYSCPPGRIRTYDRLVKSELLYQLSYGRE